MREKRALHAVLVKLGPTFVKFGQMLSTRSDLLPRIYIEALEALQDKVTSMGHEDLKKVLCSEFGCLDDYCFR
jgi:ubiquinone biosynthesis protein